MEGNFKVFFWGMLVSFLGSLPLGTMNVTVTQISIQKGVADGFAFAVGSMIIEVIIVRIALVTMKWLAKQHKLFCLLEYVTGIGIGTVLGFMVFIYAGNYLVLQIQQHQTLLNCVIGIVLLITAIIQVKKMVNVPASVRYSKIIKS